MNITDRPIYYDYNGFGKLIYKACINSIVTMRLLPDSITNEERAGVTNPNFAKFRTNKVKVVSIIDPNTMERKNKARSLCDSTFTYMVDSTIVVHFNIDIDKVCSSGIHYFKTREAALSWYYLHHEKIEGKHVAYNDNGGKTYKFVYSDKKQVESVSYYPNGKKHCKRRYNDAGIEKEEGWYDNGQKAYEDNYENGKKRGKDEGWWKNGQKRY